MRSRSIGVSLAVHASGRRTVSRRNPLRPVRYAVRARRAEAALDAMGAAALIVSGTGRLVHCNRAARELVEHQDGLLVRDGHLCATDPFAQWKLQGLIASAAANGGQGAAGGTLGVPRPAGKYLLQLLVLPLSSDGDSDRAAQVLVLVGDPKHAGRVPAQTLGALYGLTAAEAQVANALLLGQSIAQIAAERGVTSGTLRGQVKSVFRKTKTRRQSELIRLLLSVPGPQSRSG
jgi:DNA-binding CsgD family transcriptional regulator